MIKNRKVGDNRDLIDIFLEATDEDGWKFEDDDIIDSLVGLVLAGHETTATAMMWSIIYLTQHPHIMKKAKVKIYASSTVTLEGMDSLWSLYFGTKSQSLI